MVCLVFLQTRALSPFTRFLAIPHNNFYPGPSRGLQAHARYESPAPRCACGYDDIFPAPLAPVPRLLCRQSGVNARVTAPHSTPPLPPLAKPRTLFSASGSELVFVQCTDPPRWRWRTQPRCAL
ncbi:hypothetical protein L210DRAFT_3587085 [Boletus edulis BED1]|uniref:Uncharacterized protein n=1 Tax=Boletus edulis BED1 TaxID=1328754 RepID=A0AAD4BAG2_BOLED|nr:hypothetical protein L210DRAFT_3587085 [Boletus edulis BED1]